jgi:cytochrome bd-type quinol oxidase subunit 2
MIASIGPFWDANETWLVLGVGCCWSPSRSRMASS